MDRFDEEKRRVQYYSDGRFHDEECFDDRYGSYVDAGRRRGLPSWAKAVIIIVLILVAIAIFMAGCSSIIGGIAGNSDSSEVTTNFGHDYIGVLYVIDTIDEYGSGSYNHQYLLNAIDSMAEDDRNKGMILYVNTPGGSVYASDELYLKIKDYQETTGRPVYSSMQSPGNFRRLLYLGSVRQDHRQQKLLDRIYRRHHGHIYRYKRSAV